MKSSAKDLAESETWASGVASHLEGVQDCPNRVPTHQTQNVGGAFVTLRAPLSRVFGFREGEGHLWIGSYAPELSEARYGVASRIGSMHLGCVKSHLLSSRGGSAEGCHAVVAPLKKHVHARRRHMFRTWGRQLREGGAEHVSPACMDFFPKSVAALR